jgi:hypothetical protein
MYIIIYILIFLVSMNGKGYKFQLGVKFKYVWKILNHSHVW